MSKSCGCLRRELAIAAGLRRRHTAKPKEEAKQLAVARMRKFREDHPGYIQANDRMRTLQAHHISQEDHDALLERQAGRCAICGRTAEATGRKYLDIDHDHSCCPGSYSCGQCIRGLICRACNHGIGLLQDSAKVLLSAASYVERCKKSGAPETERRIPERGMLQSELHGDMQSAAEMTAPAKIN